MLNAQLFHLLAHLRDLFGRDFLFLLFVIRFIHFHDVPSFYLKLLLDSSHNFVIPTFKTVSRITNFTLFSWIS
jgi:hypothetical protein